MLFFGVSILKQAAKLTGACLGSRRLDFKQLLKEMSDEEFKEIIRKTGSTQAKIAYKKMREE